MVEKVEQIRPLHVCRKYATGQLERNVVLYSILLSIRRLKICQISSLDCEIVQ